MGLSEEGATADGGESGCAGAGGVEKGGLLAALRRGEEVVFADEMRLGLLGQVIPFLKTQILNHEGRAFKA
jgi:hypothetical protein